MYLEFFGMRELPFTLTPNTDFYIELGGQHRAFEIIQLALESCEGFIKITGEVGTGKTLLCRRLLNQLQDPYIPIHIPNPFLSPDGLLLAMAEELDLPLAAGLGRHHVMGQINHKLLGLSQRGKKVVFLLDEAQAMPEESIETLRLLTNLQTESDKLLQVVLFGQPELNDLLNRSSLRQLKQRITFSYVLPVLTHTEVTSYINHRLSRAGFPSDNLFSSKSIDDIYVATGGIPRLINILAHKALMVAYGRGDTRISHLHVSRAVEHTEDVRNDTKATPAKSAGIGWQTLVLSCLTASAMTFVLARWLLVNQ